MYLFCFAWMKDHSKCDRITIGSSSYDFDWQNVRSKLFCWAYELESFDAVINPWNVVDNKYALINEGFQSLFEKCDDYI